MISGFCYDDAGENLMDKDTLVVFFGTVLTIAIFAGTVLFHFKG